MEVKIIAKTNNMLDVVYASARTCYSKLTPIEIIDRNINEQAKIDLLTKVLGSGHTSVCEHGTFTFAITGVSRSLLGQLTRHRIASYSVQSQRYVNFKEIAESSDSMNEVVNKLCIIPEEVKKDKDKLNAYIKSCYDSIMSYCALIEKGIKPEDARQVLPMSFKTNLVCTFNVRSLMNFMQERLCNRAQSEIRELAFIMRHLIISEEEWLSPYLLPACIKNNKCKENKPCGKKVSY